MIVRLADLLALRQDEDRNQLLSEDISIMFDTFLTRFESMQNNNHTPIDTFIDATEAIVDAVLSLRPHKLLDSKIIHHPLMHFLHQLFLDKVDKWCRSPARMTFQEMDVFLKIILIFLHAVEHAPSKDTPEHHHRMNHLITIKQFLFIVRDQIDDIALNRYADKRHPNIYTLSLFAINLFHGYPFFYRHGTDERFTQNCKHTLNTFLDLL